MFANMRCQHGGKRGETSGDSQRELFFYMALHFFYVFFYMFVACVLHVFNHFLGSWEVMMEIMMDSRRFWVFLRPGATG